MAVVVVGLKHRRREHAPWIDLDAGDVRWLEVLVERRRPSASRDGIRPRLSVIGSPPMRRIPSMKIVAATLRATGSPAVDPRTCLRPRRRTITDGVDSSSCVTRDACIASISCWVMKYPTPAPRFRARMRSSNPANIMGRVSGLVTSTLPSVCDRGQ